MSKEVRGLPKFDEAHEYKVMRLMEMLCRRYFPRISDLNVLKVVMVIFKKTFLEEERDEEGYSMYILDKVIDGNEFVDCTGIEDIDEIKKALYKAEDEGYIGISRKNGKPSFFIVFDPEDLRRVE